MDRKDMNEKRTIMTSIKAFILIVFIFMIACEYFYLNYYYIPFVVFARDAQNEKNRLEENFLKESMEERLEKRLEKNNVFVNVGYVEKAGGKERYIIPIFDETSSDRLFFDETGILSASGIYYYEYEWRSDGAYVIVAAKELSEYVVEASLKEEFINTKSDRDNNFWIFKNNVIELEETSISKDLNEQEFNALLSSHWKNYVKVRLIMRDEKLMIDKVFTTSDEILNPIKCL